MKPMIYSPGRKREILHDGEYKDHKFCILNLGHHPTAYVECKLSKCATYEDERLDGVMVHGGFTYLGTANWPTNDTSRIYAGWDYAHWHDWSGTFEEYGVGDEGDKRWTTEEIFEEVKSVIDQLIPIEEAEKALEGMNK